MPPPPEDFLDRPLLRRLAGDQSFARGEEYFTAGRVRQLRAAGSRVSARVTGTRDYQVKLWRRRGELRFRCDCEAGRTENFCKHCVAVGLAWLSQSGEPGEFPAGAAAGKAAAKQDAARREEERRRLSAHLLTFDPARLASLLLEATDYDEILRRRLLLEAAGIAPAPESRGGKTSPRPRPPLADYRQLLREAIQPGSLVDFHAMPDYVQGIEEAIAPLASWLSRGWNDEVIGLVEFALIELDAASDRADIGDPLLNRVYDDLQRLHMDACRRATLDVGELAARLLDYELEGGLGIFNNAAKTYADVLGPEGRLAWRTHLIRAWSKLSAPGKTVESGGAKPPLIDHRRFQVQLLMERLAGAEGDLDALLALKRADLRSVHDYVALAEWLESVGRSDDAVRCAVNASQVFDGPQEKPVWREYLLHAYRRTGQYDAALPLAWDQFHATGEVEDFRVLKALVLNHAAARWPEWRDRALARAREVSAHARHRAGNAPSTTRPDASRLVELLLEENLADAAWQAANEGGCRADLWLTLASRRELEHPDDALGIYWRQIDQILAAAGAHGYAQAVKLLGRVRTVLLRCERGRDYEQSLAALRSNHRKKRAFLRLLSAAEA